MPAMITFQCWQIGLSFYVLSEFRLNIAIHGEASVNKAREYFGIDSDWRGARKEMKVTEKQWDNFLKGGY